MSNDEIDMLFMAVGLKLTVLWWDSYDGVYRQVVGVIHNHKDTNDPDEPGEPVMKLRQGKGCHSLHLASPEDFYVLGSPLFS